MDADAEERAVSVQPQSSCTCCSRLIVVEPVTGRTHAQSPAPAPRGDICSVPLLCLCALYNIYNRALRPRTTRRYCVDMVLLYRREDVDSRTLMVGHRCFSSVRYGQPRCPLMKIQPCRLRILCMCPKKYQFLTSGL